MYVDFLRKWTPIAVVFEEQEELNNLVKALTAVPTKYRTAEIDDLLNYLDDYVADEEYEE